MKTVTAGGFMVALAVATPAALAGQPTETLVSGGFHSGGYGGPAIVFTEMYDEFSIMVGGQGGWVINRTFMIGGAGYGMVLQPETGVVGEFGRPADLQWGYGGLVLEYMHNSHSLVHWGVQTLIGAGGGRFEDERDRELDTDGFFVTEPGVHITLNVAQVLRATMGVGYRFAVGVDLIGASDDDFSAPSGVLLLKFGRF